MIAPVDNILLCALLGVAVWTDQREQRIPNWLVLTTLCAGLLSQVLLNGLHGLAFSALGVLAGLIVFLLPYLRGGMAAGDVKLIAACGSFLGPSAAVLAGGIAMIVGALIASTLLAVQRYRGNSLTVEQMLTMRFPFAAAIAAGVALVLVIRGTL